MPSSIADRNERWTLSQAVDALGESARLAGRPGWLWVAGFVYPTVSLLPGVSIEQVVNQHLEVDPGAIVGSVGVVVVFLPLLGRLWAGLARTASPSVWTASSKGGRMPRLRDAWRAGSGLTVSTIGLWFQVALLAFAALVLLGLLPTALLSLLVTEVSRSFGVLFVALFPVVAFLLFYLLLLNLMFQIALHSLAQNRRGSVSALTHAWRIARNDPWATARATLVDFLVYATVLVIAFVVGLLLFVTCVGIPASFLVFLAANGFLGVTRACYWARAYRALGGLSPDDRVPGLDGGAAEAGAA